MLVFSELFHSPSFLFILKPFGQSRNDISLFSASSPSMLIQRGDALVISEDEIGENRVARHMIIEQCNRWDTGGI